MSDLLSTQPGATPTAQEGSRPRRWGPWLAGAVLLVGLVAVAFTGSGYLADVGVYIAVSVILASSLGLVVGYMGQISLGHAAFFACGAYASGILTATYGWPALPAAAVGIAAATLLGFGVGGVVLRLSGYYLAMATLALTAVVVVILESAGGITGGGTGLTGIPRVGIGSWELDGGAMLLLSAAVAAAVVAANAAIHRSPLGRTLFAIHADEHMAAAVGIDVFARKRSVFALASAQAALAGSLYAHHLRFLAPADFDVLESVQIVVMVMIGGGAAPLGPVLGATLMTGLPELVASMRDYELLVTGALLVLVVVFLPDGLIGLRRMARRRMGDRP